MVYVFLADGFETVEALCPIDIMRRAGIEVTTVSINKTTSVKSKQNIIVTADITAAKLPSPEKIAENLEAVVLPGGLPGADNLDASDAVDAMLSIASVTGAWIAAICAAPYILGKRGLLKGKKAICYPGFEDMLDGASVTDAKVVTDGNIITAKAMGASCELGFELVTHLRSYSLAEEIRGSVYY